jgi:hypothetical protein
LDRKYHFCYATAGFGMVIFRVCFGVGSPLVHPCFREGVFSEIKANQHQKKGKVAAKEWQVTMEFCPRLVYFNSGKLPFGMPMN